jgi:hypothetical protein
MNAQSVLNVIPANAGIQARSKNALLFPRIWIPAFAGMTYVGAVERVGMMVE